MTPAMAEDYADSSFLISLNCADANSKDALSYMARHPVSLPFTDQTAG